MSPDRVWGVVLAGGRGARFGAAKQFATLDGLSLLGHSVRAAATVCGGLVVVVPPGTTVDPLVAVTRAVPGGASRSGSVRAGLAAVPDAAEVVVVADAAHPLASPALFRAVVDAVRAGADGAFPGLPLSEVVAQVGPDGVRTGSLPRQGHVLVQMPQAFRAPVLRAAHAEGVAGVEDSSMVAQLLMAGRPARVQMVPGEVTNLHVTTVAELEMARRLVTMVPTRAV